jgi:molybdopterin-guanine dinucleotide biosynthesis protein B
VKRLHIIGRKNHGKTTLVTDLVRQLKSSGWRVGTIKHTHHQHELDTPGKDSFQHRTAGADMVGILTRSLNAVFWEPDTPRDQGDPYESFAAMFSGCDLVLVEGDVHTDAPKLEVWRAAAGSSPLAAGDASILAVVTDDRPEVPQPLLRRSDVPHLADWITRRFALSPGDQSS